jgi:hypothetical protein
LTNAVESELPPFEGTVKAGLPDLRTRLIVEGHIGYVATSSSKERRCVVEGQPKEKEEKFGGRYIPVTLRASGGSNRLAEAQKLLPFGYSGVYGESLEGFGRAEEGKVPTYLEAIANLRDLLAYCHVWGRMTFDVGEEDDEAREVVETLDEEAITITPADSQRVREKVMESLENMR